MFGGSSGNLAAAAAEAEYNSGEDNALSQRTRSVATTSRNMTTTTTSTTSWYEISPADVEHGIYMGDGEEEAEGDDGLARVRENENEGKSSDGSE